MLYAMDYIQPSSFPVRQGAILPFGVEVTSLEIPVQVQVFFDLPDNLAAIDQIPTMTQVDVQQNIWRWNVMLGEFDSAQATFYAQLLDGDDAVMDILVAVEIEDELIEIGQTQLLLPSEAPRDFMSDGIVLLQALVMNYPDDSDFADVLGDAQAAQTARSSGDIQGAVDALMNAVTPLADSDVYEAEEARWVLDVALLALLGELNP